MSDDHRITFRMPEVAWNNLQIYCSQTGQKPSEVARAGIALMMGPWQNSFVGHTSDNSHAPARVNNIDLSKDKSSCPTKGEIQKWFKSFWVHVENQMFEDRVIKTIKDKWEDLKSKDPAELGKQYTAYCNAEVMKNRQYSHPNAWLSGGGYNNKSKEEEGGMHYDIN